MSEPILVGVDTGGTFTDVVAVRGGRMTVHKEPSTPANPAEAVVRGLKTLLQEVPDRLVHGSTVATNALLERRGARIALVTTRGFEDVIEIGRQTRRAIYDIDVTKPPPLVPPERRLGITERVGPGGQSLTALHDDDLDALCDALSELAVDGVAICFLHSYANPGHEQRVAARLRESFPGFVTASHEVLPEFREFERCSTTVVNAYVGPVMATYLRHLERELPGDNLRIMQSNGGVISVQAAQRHAVQTILSGPAGGAVGGFELGQRAGQPQVITFDMGGTSTDVSLCAGTLSRTPEASVGDLPIRVPVIDIHTVGAGGGSIAYVDPGGSLRVGPRSAGADPGPICYGCGGTEITVTDANLFLGRLVPDHFLGGAQRLDVKAVNSAIHALAGTLRLSPVETATGVLRVANATMERAIRVISLERGHDPRDFALMCFGGAGGMHAADLARSLAIPRVVVPPSAGVLSALGMLLADVVRDYSHTLLRPTDDTVGPGLETAFTALEDRALEDFVAEGFDTPDVRLQRSVDVRYVGQGFELSVPASGDLVAAFHALHHQRYGYADTARPTEIVNVRVRAAAETPKPVLPTLERAGTDVSDAVVGKQAMVVGDHTVPVPVYDRERLGADHRVRGPALVVEYSTTTVIPLEWMGDVDGTGSLILQLGEAG